MYRSSYILTKMYQLHKMLLFENSPTLLLFIRIVKTRIYSSFLCVNCRRSILSPYTFKDAHLNLWSVLMMLVKYGVVKIFLIPFLRKKPAPIRVKKLLSNKVHFPSTVWTYICVAILNLKLAHSIRFLFNHGCYWYTKV